MNGSLESLFYKAIKQEVIIRLRAQRIECHLKTNYSLPIPINVPEQFVKVIEYILSNRAEWLNDNKYIVMAHDSIRKQIIVTPLNNKLHIRMDDLYCYQYSIFSSSGEKLFEIIKNKPVHVISEYHLSTLKYEKCIDLLAERINNQNKIDIILGISRSGLVPAIYLGYRLGVKDVRSLSLTTNQPRKSIMQINNKPSKCYLPIRGKNVLLVDSLLDKGKTMYKALTLLSMGDPKTILSCAMIYLPTTLIVPKVYAYRFPVWKWLYCPWDKCEVDNKRQCNH
jgi:uncharacterized protein